MSGQERPRPLTYGEELNREQVEERLAEIRGIIDEVGIKYALPTGESTQVTASRQVINPEDNELLMKCIGVLLPMGMLAVVQKEAMGVDPEHMENTTLGRISQLQVEILTYASGFENTGVRLFGGSIDPVTSPKPSNEGRLTRFLKGLRRRS